MEILEGKNKEENAIPQFDFDAQEVVAYIGDEDEQLNENEQELKPNFLQENEEVLGEGENEEDSEEINDDDAANAVYDTLVQKGIFNPLNEERTATWDDIDNNLSNLTEGIVSKILTDAPDAARDTIEYAFALGEDASMEKLAEFFQDYMTDSQSQLQAPSNTSDARTRLKSIYAKEGKPEFMIEAMIDALEDNDEDGSALINEATKQIKKYNSVSKSSSKLEQAKTTSAQKQREQELLYNSATTVLQSKDWSPKRQALVDRALTTGASDKVFKEAFNSPKALVQLANLSTYFNPQTQEFDFTSFINQSLSKDIKDKKENLIKNAFQSMSKTKIKQNQRRGGSLFDGLRPIT